jgi:DNA-binding GntR family transcriptional regulator
MNDTLLQQSPRVTTTYVSLSDEIHALLLNSFIDGELTPGTRINDHELAQKLGVSHTPVREALRGLQTLGIIETLPARVTRIATLTTEEFNNAKTVWASLYKVLLTDIIHNITNQHITQMTKLCNQLTHTHNHPTTTFRLFETLTTLTDNTFLKESIHTAACRMRLGYLNSDDGVNNYFRITFTQAEEFLTALVHKDLYEAHCTLSRILGVQLLDVTENVTGGFVRVA